MHSVIHTIRARNWISSQKQARQGRVFSTTIPACAPPPLLRPATTSGGSAGCPSGQLITWGSVFYTFALLMEPVERELGLTRAQSSLAFSLALLAEGLLAYPVGRWIDRGMNAP
jgi:hypothetical protein